MYLNSTVPVPDKKGKITFKKKGDSRYVLLEIDRVYDPKRRFNVPKRAIIGKLVDNDATDRMIPNEKFLEYFPEVPVKSEKPALQRSRTITVGSYIAFMSIVKEYGLDKLLAKIFGDKGGLILDLASYLIVEEDNAAQHYPAYARRHALFTKDMNIVSDSTVSRLLSGVSGDQITSFLDAWNRKQDHRQRIYISYDSTNKNSQAGDIDLVEFGHAKDDQGRPIFNVSLAFDKTNRVPLFYEEYPGSINDVGQLTYLLDKVYTYGYRSIGFILDRGYFSKDNIKHLDDKGFQFLMMVKGCKRLVSSMIKDHRGTFEVDHVNYIAESGIYGITVKRKLYEGDGKERYFHLYFNPLKMAHERVEIENKIKRMACELRKLEGTECTVEKPALKYFKCHYQDLGGGRKRLLFAEEDTKAIAEELSLCGYFCIVSSEKMTAAEAYRLYRGRDVSEKLFRDDKSFLGSRTQRVHSNESVSTKIFLEFIALIIRNRFYNLLKDEMLKLNVNKNWLTVPAAIRELEKVEMTKYNDTRYLMEYALTKNQKTILQSLGLKADDVSKSVQEIGDLLADVKEKTVEQYEDENNAETQDDIDF